MSSIVEPQLATKILKADTSNLLAARLLLLKNPPYPFN
jgi:hypothetical protein